jgi:predicted DNA-binding transcriptional regulator AlpA
MTFQVGLGYRTDQVTGEFTMTVFTESKVAETLGVSVSGMRKWRREGTGPQFTRIGKLIRYSAEDLQSWLDKRKEGSK